MKKSVFVGLSLVVILSSVTFAKEAELPEDGNTGDLRLEDGAVLWPKISEEEKKEMEERQKQLEQEVKDPRYQEALEESRKVEEAMKAKKKEDRAKGIESPDTEVPLVLNFWDKEVLQSEDPLLFFKNRKMVPIRLLAEHCGYSVEWNGDENKIHMSVLGSEEGQDVIILDLEKAAVKPLESDSYQPIPLHIHNNRTYVPLSFLGKYLHEMAFWDRDTGTLYITRGSQDFRRDEDYLGKIIMIKDDEIESKDDQKPIPGGMKEGRTTGEIGKVIAVEGDLLKVDMIYPTGDAITDPDCRRGYVPKESVVVEPTDRELEILSKVCRLNGDKVEFTNYETGEAFDATPYVGRFLRIFRRGTDRIIIELPGGSSAVLPNTDGIDFDYDTFVTEK